MWACGSGHQSAEEVGRRRYSWGGVRGEYYWDEGEYISVVDDDEGVGGMGSGNEGDAHVVVL